MIRHAAAPVLLAMVAGAWAGGALAEDRSCVDVKIGEQMYYSCLNRTLRDFSQSSRTPPQLPPLGIDSPAPALGLFDQAATRERLGNNFGKSVVPQRPPPPHYGSPLAR